ncbi:MAG TPA: ribulose-phosphate 3-epimerase [Chitinophagaceae bacterium]|nr:ribulose-phosphate 3-epimerase [Chitinophagaceae bacterium]
MPLIAPSVLSANFLHLSADIAMINQSEADWFHLDVMDGRFVPNISFGLPVIAAIKKEAKKTLDVHLMIEEPGQYAEAFRNAGADILSVHIEACPHLHRNLQQIKSLGMKAGIAINPHTPVQQLFDVLHDCDVVCMMSVNPGFGGQHFIEHTLEKISRLKEEILRRNLNVLIEVDGGVTIQNAATICEAGADVLVAGNTVFSSSDPTATISALKHGNQ